MMPIDHMLGPRRGVGVLQHRHRFDDPNDCGNEYMRQRRRGLHIHRGRADFYKGRTGMGLGFNRRPGFMGRPVAMPFGRGVRFQRPMFGGHARLSPFATRLPRYQVPLSSIVNPRGSLDLSFMQRYRPSFADHSWPSIGRGYPPPRPPRPPYEGRHSFPPAEYEDDEDIFEDDDAWLHSDTDDDWGGSDCDDGEYHDDFYSQSSPYNTYTRYSMNYPSTYRDTYDASYGSGYGYGCNTDQQSYGYQHPYPSQFRYRGY